MIFLGVGEGMGQVTSGSMDGCCERGNEPSGSVRIRGTRSGCDVCR
jgi:hypothetical protein